MEQSGDEKRFDQARDLYPQLRSAVQRVMKVISQQVQNDAAT
jgi:hypothetical protein